LRLNGQRIRLDGAIGSTAFAASYRAAMAQIKVDEAPAPAPVATKSAAIGTLRANVDRYFASALFAALAPTTQEIRRRILDRWCDGDEKRGRPGYGDLPLAQITPDAFGKMMYSRERNPGAQRGFLCAVRHFLKDCRKARTIAKDFDPTRDERCGRGQNPEGHKCWPIAYVEQYRKHWPRGTMQRLALELLYESGAACVDVVRLGPDSIDDNGLLIFDRQKTGTGSFRPMTPALERELAAGPVAVIGGPWLRTKAGRPFTPRYFGERFRAWAQDAGIPEGYSAHGIRKRAATDDAESGATATELMVMYGWRDIKQAAHYTTKADAIRVALGRLANVKTGTDG
jgi:hypothetical protein